MKKYGVQIHLTNTDDGHFDGDRAKCNYKYYKYICKILYVH